MLVLWKRNQLPLLHSTFLHCGSMAKYRTLFPSFPPLLSQHREHQNYSDMEHVKGENRMLQQILAMEGKEKEIATDKPSAMQHMHREEEQHMHHEKDELRVNPSADGMPTAARAFCKHGQKGALKQPSKRPCSEDFTSPNFTTGKIPSTCHLHA